jgi:glycosyltransferase involved in cell wall biosynthesis
MFHNPLQLLKRFRQIRDSLEVAIRDADVTLLKVPGTLSNLALPILLRTDKRFGVNVVGDPAEVLRGPVAPALLRPLVRRWFVRNMRRQCRAATVAIYVSNHVLPDRYPPGPTTATAYLSNVDLSEESFRRPSLARLAGPFHIVTVGSLEQAYKGVDVLLRAFAPLARHDMALELTVVGDGRARKGLEELAHSLGIDERLRFVGSVPGPAAVRELVSEADLFVLASRTEGLPRALIEAMALGVPSIGTSVGGIPELLPPEDRVAPDDVVALSKLIKEVIDDPHRRTAMSERNFDKAREYRESFLRPRRLAAYQRLAESARPPVSDP